MKNTLLYLKLTFVVFVGLFISNCLNAQNDLDNDVLLGKHINPKFDEIKRKRNNPIGVDFHLLGTSFHYAKKIKGNIFFGVEAGLLPDLFDWVILADRYISEENTIFSEDKSEAGSNSFDQLLFAHVFIRIKPENEYFEMDAGLRAAVYSRSGDDLDLTNFYGGYIKPLIGKKRFKVGVRFEIGIVRGNYHGPFNEFVIIASPLVRFNFRKT